MLRADIAAELESSRSGMRRFIRVCWVPERHPLDESPGPAGQVGVRVFEIAEDLLNGSYQPFDGDFEVVVHEYAESVDDAEAVVASLGVDPSILDAPWKCAIPM